MTEQLLELLDHQWAKLAGWGLAALPVLGLLARLAWRLRGVRSLLPKRKSEEELARRRRQKEARDLERARAKDARRPKISRAERRRLRRIERDPGGEMIQCRSTLTPLAEFETLKLPRYGALSSATGQLRSSISNVDEGGFTITTSQEPAAWAEKDSCDKTTADCRRHGNIERYGGFGKPGVDLKR